LAANKGLTNSTQRSKSNSDKHEDSDILTISDSSEDEERRETDAMEEMFVPLQV